MNAMKNAVNLGVLALWAVAGLVFSLKALSALALAPTLGFWLWFGAFAALMSWAVGALKHPAAALGAHAAAFAALHLIPQVIPFSLLRLGLDLLRG